MKVKEIWFLPTCFGIPIYEMENGELRLPYKNQQTRDLFWMTEDEMQGTITTKDLVINMKSKALIKKQFEQYRKEIDELKSKNALSKVG